MEIFVDSLGLYRIRRNGVILAWSWATEKSAQQMVSSLEQLS